MTLLQQLDSIFSVANGLLFILIGLIVVCLYVLINERKCVEVVLATTSSPVFEAEPEHDWAQEEADAHYANEIVECSGMCLCEKLFVFTTTEAASSDHEFCTMIACSHCDVCNPEGLVDVVDDSPVLTVLNEVQEGERVTFHFNDGSTAIMRAYTFDGLTERQLDAPSEGGYRVDSIQQARAIDAFTGGDCIPF